MHYSGVTAGCGPHAQQYHHCAPMPFSHSILTPEEKELMRRAQEARRLVRNEGLDPWTALWWVTAPDGELETAKHLLTEDRRAA